jgi:uncharacterized protein YndB with AHSA1/START domain
MKGRQLTMTDLAVRKDVTVQAPIDKAFRVFTEGIDTWWIREHHIGASALKQVVLESRQGGRWYEIGVDGAECDWGRVLHWEPPQRLVLAWQLDANWQFDPTFITEVEIRFVADGPHRTSVELEHRHLERFGDDHDAIRDSFDSPGGWQGLLDAFARAAT